MCGINGFSWSDKKLLRAMNQVLAHRGPDDAGEFTDKKVSLGQRRLSIIDLSPAGHQPMFYTHKKRTVGITFNGEIYNYQSIKAELVALGYTFKSSSDTEVILAAYLAWGVECVQRMNGMWAFCLYDKANNLLFCSRDRAGKKPFYYYMHAGRFVFSSELKGIFAHKKLRLRQPANINREALDLYLSLGYIPSPYTIFKHVSKLEPRENLLFDLRTKSVTRRWHYYELPAYNPVYDKKQLLAEGRALLKDAVRLRMIADVPVGAFLSGGLDSSTVVAEMAHFTDLKKLHTFSIGFEGPYDESYYISVVAKHFHTQHHHQYFHKEDFEKLIPKYSDIYDEPFADYSGFPTYAVSKLARSSVTVSLSGDGGDEIFGGYQTHRMGHQMDLLRRVPRPVRTVASKLPIKKNLSGTTNLYTLKEAFRLSLLEPEQFYSDALSHDTYRPAIFRKLTRERLAYCLTLSDGSLGESLRLYDLLFNTLGDHYLVKVDRASMAVGLEVRCPFLDYRLLEYSQRLPAQWKADAFSMKKFMRLLIKDIVPKEIVTRGKKGFTPPIDKWILDEKHKPTIERGLLTLRTLHPPAVEFYERVVSDSNKLYTLYKIRLFLFQLWWERWMQ